MRPSAFEQASLRASVAAFLLAGAGTIVLALPHALSGWVLSPDVIGYIGAAYAWVEGRGFVDPFLYTFYLQDLAPPVPSTAIRPPVVSLLTAIPVSLGASLTGVSICHVLWSACIGGGGAAVAGRMGGWPAALAMAVAVGWSPIWIELAPVVLADVTAVGILLLTLVGARPLLRSMPGALALALLLIVGWLTRPNLVILVPAVLLTAAWEFGPRRALRTPSLWVFGLGFLALQQLIAAGIEATTGQPLYAQYGMMLKVLSRKALHLYQYTYPAGSFELYLAQPAAVWTAFRDNASAWIQLLLFDPIYHGIGWLTLPALMFGLLAKGSARFEHRLAAIAAVGFGAVTLAAFSFSAPARYGVPAVVCGWLLATSMLAAGGTMLWRRLERHGATNDRAHLWRAAIGLLPLAAALLVFGATGAPASIQAAQNAIASYRVHGTIERWPASRRGRPPCSLFEPGAVVASRQSYVTYLYCGNPSVRLPLDLSDGVWIDRFVDERQVAFIEVPNGPLRRPFERSERLERVGILPAVTVYRVRRPGPRSHPWPSSLPLSRMGRTKGIASR